MRPDVYKPPATKPRGRRLFWLPEPNRPVKLLILVAVLAGLGAAGWKFFAPAAGEWGHDLDAGFAAAAQQGKPLLVLYSADWCTRCRTLETAVLRDRKIDAFLEREFVRVKVDLSDRQGPNNRLAAKAKVRELPAMIVYNPKGREVKRLTGLEIGTWIKSQAKR
jgi:thiol:disulfide interchange protein